MENNSNTYTKGTILIVILLFMFSSKLLDITWDIVKGFIYLIVIIYIISFLNPLLAGKIKEIVLDLLSVDNVKDVMSKVASKILYVVTPNKIQSIQPNDLKINENRSIDNVNDTNNRKLT
jgi:hypothetical protein